MSREWTDVARQCRRRYQFAASDVLSIVRGLANGHGVALHAAPAATPATTAATSAAPVVASIAPVASAFALHCPDLHDMFSESLGILRPEVCKTVRVPGNLFASHSHDRSFPRKTSRSPNTGECIAFFFRIRRGSDDLCSKGNLVNVEESVFLHFAYFYLYASSVLYDRNHEKTKIIQNGQSNIANVRDQSICLSLFSAVQIAIRYIEFINESIILSEKTRLFSRLQYIYFLFIKDIKKLQGGTCISITRKRTESLC